MSLPAVNNFQLYRGDTLRFRLNLEVSGSVMNIPAGTTFSAAVKEYNKTSTTASFLPVIESASAGQVLFTLSSAGSTLLDHKKKWLYDVQMTDGEGNVTTLISGNIFVIDQVTS